MKRTKKRAGRFRISSFKALFWRVLALCRFGFPISIWIPLQSPINLRRPSDRHMQALSTSNSRSTIIFVWNFLHSTRNLTHAMYNYTTYKSRRLYISVFFLWYIPKPLSVSARHITRLSCTIGAVSLLASFMVDRWQCIHLLP